MRHRSFIIAATILIGLWGADTALAQQTAQQQAGAPPARVVDPMIAFRELPLDRQKAIARKLYDLGFGDGVRQPGEAMPSWVANADTTYIGTAATAWRKALRGGNDLPKWPDAAEIEAIMAQSKPTQWAAIAYASGSSRTPEGTTSARTWNRPSRQLAENIVIERCTAKAPKSEHGACYQSLRVSSGASCLGLTYVIGEVPQRKDLRQMPIEGIMAGPKPNRSDIEAELAHECKRFERNGGTCRLRHAVCPDGRNSF